MEAAELTRWRQQHPRYTYWCGTLLGGCGEPLTDRRYHSKVCHFAHHPHHTCTRTANGEDSADHLFMKRALHNWIGSQGFKGAVHLHKNTAAPGSTIDVDLQGSPRRLRFRLRPDNSGSWGLGSDKADALGEGEADWIFGLGGPTPEEFLDDAGYVFRIRFETQGAERCPYLGVQQRGRAPEWTPFADAALTVDGLSTPAVEEIRAARRRSKAGTGSSGTRKPSPETSLAERRTVRHMNQEELVVALRDALELDARWAIKPTWERLGQMIGVDFSRYSDADLVGLLTEVDTPFSQDDPVLSALIRTNASEPLPYLVRVLDGLGLGRPSSAPHLKRWAQREADRAFAKYGIPARTMPPTLPLDAAVPEVPVVLPHSPRRGATARNRRSVTQHDQTPTAWKRLQRLITEGQELLGGTRGKSAARLKRELRTARRLLEGTRRTRLNSRGLNVLWETSALLETAIAGARKAAHQNQKTSGEGRGPSPSVEPSKPDDQQRAARPSKVKRTAVPVSSQDLRQRLISVAQAGSTTHWLLLAGGKSTPQEVRLTLLSQAEDRSEGDAPLLSALVVAPDGGPVPYFREILKSVGLAVPQSNEALLKIWHREQERAHAAYADPPRPVPPRLVPRKAAADAAQKPA
ncbi:competence protein CoiA family protein [Streptomyces sp. GS7]|uniref:competence protein CoiA family protein n=1 Tax=Streptomyces sp. GS7 TaxID=2692234 RepID=UPI001317064C|nr:competence protein CoiA family protein [Streptomyces sp. GS7]QHC26248.1 hypothetical protein GR130_37630 [Streptomyces sp. GS7]